MPGYATPLAMPFTAHAKSGRSAAMRLNLAAALLLPCLRFPVASAVKPAHNDGFPPGALDACPNFARKRTGRAGT